MIKRSIAFVLASALVCPLSSGNQSSSPSLLPSFFGFHGLFTQEALAPSLTTERFSPRWPTMVSMLHELGESDVMAETAEGPSIKLRLDSETNFLFDLAEAHGLDIGLTGSMARRMIWGEKPFSDRADSDADFFVHFSPGDQSGQTEVAAKLREFEKVVKIRFPNLSIDVVNHPFQNRSFGRRVTVNALNISRRRGKWVVKDEAGGAYVADARARLIRLEPLDRPLRLSDLSKVIKTQDASKTAGAQLDEEMISEFDILFGRGLIDDRNESSLLAEAISKITIGEVEGIAENPSDPHGHPSIIMSDFLIAFLSVMMRSLSPFEVLETLRRWETPIGNLVTVFHRAIDLDGVARTVDQAHRSGATLTQRDLDPYWISSLRQHPLASVLDPDRVEQWLAGELTKVLSRPISSDESHTLGRFLRVELSGWLEKHRIRITPWRIQRAQNLFSVAASALLNEAPTTADLLKLAGMLNTPLGDHMTSRATEIKAAIDHRTYKHFLEYSA